ncbi:MAG: hypothetical protein QW403_03615 [Candidatus Aenigmatarchaeota archaeon]
MVLSAPIIAGINIEQQLAKFFLQSMVASVVVMISVLIAGMFFGPDLPGKIQEKLGARYLGALLVGGIIIGITLLVTSGLTSIFFPEGFVEIPEDVVISVATIAVLLLVIAGIVIFVSREEKKK